MKCRILYPISLLCLLLCLSALCIGTAALEAGADGRVHLQSAEDVLALMCDETLWSSSIVLDRTVDLGGADGQTPIGSADNRFCGEFDGQGYAVEGIDIDGGADNFIGLFGVVDNGKIHDLTVRGEVTSTGLYVGGLCGAIYEGSEIVNCVNYCTVTGSTEVGGLIGVIAAGVSGSTTLGASDDAAADLLLSGCVNRGSVTSSATMAGGIAGSLRAGTLNAVNAVQILRCANDGTVVGGSAAAYKSYVGGIVGIIADTASAITLSECKNAGEIYGLTYVGGIAGGIRIYAGAANKATVSFCHNGGVVHSANTAAAQTSGGIVGGQLYASGTTAYSWTISNCYNDGKLLSSYSGTTTNLRTIVGTPRKFAPSANFYNADSGIDADSAGGRFAVAAADVGSEAAFTASDGSKLQGDNGEWTFTVTGPELTAFHVHTPTGDGEVTKAPTLTENGEMTYDCSTCGACYTEDIPRLAAQLGAGGVYVAKYSDGTATLRFITTIALAADSVVTVRSFGTFISRIEIGETGSSDFVRVEKDETLSADTSFAVDLTGIPEASADTQIFAWSFAVLSNGETVGIAFSPVTVNGLIGG